MSLGSEDHVSCMNEAVGALGGTQGAAGRGRAGSVWGYTPV